MGKMLHNTSQLASLQCFTLHIQDPVAATLKSLEEVTRDLPHDLSNILFNFSDVF